MPCNERIEAVRRQAFRSKGDPDRRLNAQMKRQTISASARVALSTTLIKNVNLSGAIDSPNSLDERAWMFESAGMITQPYHIYIERTEAAKNMARYYAMEISKTLFGDTCLTRSWGRIGGRGQSKMHHFKCENEAVDLFLDLMRQKRKRGYRPKVLLHKSLE